VKDVSNMVVSCDDAKLQTFWEEHQHDEPRGLAPGYKTPDLASLTVLRAATVDFVSTTPVTVQELREHYEINKQKLWLNAPNEDGTRQPKPFPMVRSEVEKDYRLTQAAETANEHIKKALVAWQEGTPFRDLCKEYKLRTDILEHLSRHDLEQLPDDEGDSWALSRCFEAATGDLSAEPIVYGSGVAIWRLDDMLLGTSQSFEDMQDRVKSDFIITKQLEAAKEKLAPVKASWDQTGSWEEAMQSLTADAVIVPTLMPLGSLDSQSEVPALGDDSFDLV
jgi:hypothetical protein